LFVIDAEAAQQGVQFGGRPSAVPSFVVESRRANPQLANGLNVGFSEQLRAGKI